jgi:hypothetical protein
MLKDRHPLNERNHRHIRFRLGRTSRHFSKYEPGLLLRHHLGSLIRHSSLGFVNKRHRNAFSKSILSAPVDSELQEGKYPVPPKKLLSKSLWEALPFLLAILALLAAFLWTMNGTKEVEDTAFYD